VILAGAVIASLLVGFLGGLVSFKKAQEFCPDHGVTKNCPLCLAAGR
jgi:hypothetical protein